MAGAAFTLSLARTFVFSACLSAQLQPSLLKMAEMSHTVDMLCEILPFSCYFHPLVLARVQRTDRWTLFGQSCAVSEKPTDLILPGWFCYYRGGSWFLVTEQKLVLLMHHLTAVIHRPVLVLLAQPCTALQRGFCLSPHHICFLILHSVWHEDVENLLVWQTSLLTGFPSQPWGWCRALGQVRGVCLWSQPELKGRVDLALGELCTSQIFIFPSDNLSVVSSLVTTKCFFIPKPS